MPAREVHLTDYLDSLIETGVASGRFADADEVVCEALRLLDERDQEHRAKLEWLRSAAAEGFDALDRGDSITLNSQEELAAFFKEVHDEVVAELTPKCA